MKADAGERQVFVFWGPTGTGKSRLAWQEAGIDAYPKAPTSKFWDGYQGHENVVIDEFTGQIDITHLLRWFDRYPVCVETKGSGTVLKAKRIWLTSNIDPREWYPTAPKSQQDALKRRFTMVKHFPMPIFSSKRLPDVVEEPSPNKKGAEACDQCDLPYKYCDCPVFTSEPVVIED